MQEVEAHLHAGRDVAGGDDPPGIHHAGARDPPGGREIRKSPSLGTLPVVYLVRSGSLRDLRNIIDGLSPTELRDRLKSKIGDMTTALQDGLPRSVEFASATAEPSGDGFNIAVSVRITDGGIP